MRGGDAVGFGKGDCRYGCGYDCGVAVLEKGKSIVREMLNV